MEAIRRSGCKVYQAYHKRSDPAVMEAKHAMRQQAINFLKALRGEESPMCEAEESWKDLQTADQYVKLWEKGS